MVMCEGWLWAPYSLISFEQGQRLVTGATTSSVSSTACPERFSTIIRTS
jgi:hypothetical protein